MKLPEGKKIYFASDFHLGLPNATKSRERERLICRWLEEISQDAAKIFLVGDVFDVWFEYRKVIPKGFTRFLGQLARLTDRGISIEIFTGNHDLWMWDYFEEEFGIPTHHEPIQFEVSGKRFYLGHGDGLGPGDRGYKFLKSVLNHPIAKWLYRRIHPDTGIALADYFSKRGSDKYQMEHPYKGNDEEYLMQFCLEMVAKGARYDYFIFGHRHLALDKALPGGSRYVNLGDWLIYNSYAVFDGTDLALKYYDRDEKAS